MKGGHVHLLSATVQMHFIILLAMDFNSDDNDVYSCIAKSWLGRAQAHPNVGCALLLELLKVDVL